MEEIFSSNPEFEVHLLNEQGIRKAQQIAEDFNTLLNALKLYIPASREFAITRTKLEEACFFAKKAVANSPYNQKSFN